MVFDLGCGDGRIVILAAQKFGARGVGVDIDANLINQEGEKVQPEAEAAKAKAAKDLQDLILGEAIPGRVEDIDHGTCDIDAIEDSDDAVAALKEEFETILG